VRRVGAGARRLKPSFFRGEETVVFRTFWKDESGLELSEYAVAAALVAIAAVVAFQTLGANIGARINTLAGYIK
jgi:Flp pilus assembly pilin Flp